MSLSRPRPPLVVALRLDDPDLAKRIGLLLAAVPGLRLASRGEPADLALVAVADREIDERLDAPLTPREREVLVLLSQGASNKSIAARLAISVHTAKFHVSRVIDKLDATGRTDAVAQAARWGVIHL